MVVTITIIIVMSICKYLENYIYANDSIIKNYKCQISYHMIMEIEKQRGLSKQDVYDILDAFAFSYYHNYIIITMDIEDFKQIVAHFNLFRDNYKIKNDACGRHCVNFLVENNYKFTMDLKPDTFRWFSSSTLIWLYDNCDNKDLYHEYIRNESMLDCSQFVCWYAKLIDSHEFLFSKNKFQYINVDHMEQYLNDTHYNISTQNVKGMYMCSVMFEFLLDKYVEKNDPLQLYEGLTCIKTDLKTKKMFNENNKGQQRVTK